MELRFVAKESDFLILETESGERHRLLIDDSIRDALRNTEQIRSSQASPKDIQNLLRSGKTVSEVAMELGVTEGAIAPFAAPILDEIAFVLSGALNTQVSDGQNMMRLEELVLQAQPDSSFGAFRESGNWVVMAKGNQNFSWRFDPRTKSLEPNNEAAKKLANLHSARDVVSQTIPARSHETVLPEPQQVEVDTPQASVHDLVQELRSRRAKPEEVKPSSAKGRASLPSWDEIVSGAHLDSND